MSVKTIYKCDRCGHEYQEIDLYQGEDSESTITINRQKSPRTLVVG